MFTGSKHADPVHPSNLVFYGAIVHTPRTSGESLISSRSPVSGPDVAVRSVHHVPRLPADDIRTLRRAIRLPRWTRPRGALGSEWQE